MGLENKKSKKSKKQETKQVEIKEYIRGAGGSIVSKSILNGTSKLKWLFRDDSGHGNGWIAFGDTDTQEYVNNAENMAVVDFNILANIEPTVLNVYYMPVGSDLEFRSDKTGKYFVDTRTGKELREPVKHPGQTAFEKNLKFLNQETYPMEFFEGLFEKNNRITLFTAGEVDLPTGEVVLADPLVYLGTKYSTVLARKVPCGRYPVELSLCHSGIVGLRVAAARLIFSDHAAARYEIALPKGNRKEDLGKPRVFTFFGVDCGTACFADIQTEAEYREFFKQWQGENPNKNKYIDYFAMLFKNSYKKYPEVQNECTNFLQWEIPGTGSKLTLFSSGMGDGVYSGYWGLDEQGEPVSLVVPFMNPAYF
ncbi:MAG: DUF2185 domain-containing protein [Dorea sp.]|nr:DUF2185 domain-containing protein [Dorea sp.]